MYFFLTVKLYGVFFLVVLERTNLDVIKAFLRLTADSKENTMMITGMIKQHNHPAANTIGKFHILAKRILFINSLIIRNLESN